MKTHSHAPWLLRHRRLVTCGRLGGMALALLMALASELCLAHYSWSFVESAHVEEPWTTPLPVVFKLRRQAEVAGDYTYLSEVADCVGESQACDEAFGIRLFASPAPGAQVPVNKHVIAKILAEEWPGKDWRLEGPTSLRVRAAEVRYSAADLRQALERQVAQASTPELRFTLQDLRLSAALRLRPATYDIFCEQWQEDVGRGYEWVLEKYKVLRPLDLRLVPLDAAQLAEKTVRVLARVEVRAEVLLSRRSIPAGASLTADDVLLDWQPINAPLSAYPRGLDELATFRLRYPMPAGQVIRRHQLQAPEAIARGRLLNLRVKQGGMVVNGRVRALQSGGVGDVIAVMYDDTKTRLQARVLDASTVVLER